MYIYPLHTVNLTKLTSLPALSIYLSGRKDTVSLPISLSNCLTDFSLTKPEHTTRGRLAGGLI